MNTPSLTTVNEFEAVLKYRQTYDDMVHGFLGLFKEFLNWTGTASRCLRRKRFRRMTANVTVLISPSITRSETPLQVTRR